MKIIEISQRMSQHVITKELERVCCSGYPGGGGMLMFGYEED